MIEIAPLNLTDVLHVCKNMRQQDWLEVLNLLPLSVTTADTVAMIVMNVSRLGFVAKIDGEPAAVLQVSEILDGSFRFGLFGTSRFEEVALALCCHVLEMIPDLIDKDGLKYADAYADALHDEAHKLLEFLGFRKTAILPGYGSHSCDIALFTISKGQADVLRNGRWRRILNASRDTNVATRNGGNRRTAGVPQAAGQPAERV